MNNDRFYFIELFDIYQELLTKKQQEQFKLYFFDDWSLNEIAEHFQISKNAIYDSIEKAKSSLLNFENILKFNDKSKKRQVLYQKIEDEELKQKLLDLEH